MNSQIIEFIGNRLLADVDIEEEVDKEMLEDFEAEDLSGNVVFVELYAEIPLEDLENLAYEINIGLNSLLETLERLIERESRLLVDFVFTHSPSLEEYQPLVEHIEPYKELVAETRDFIIDINIMATLKQGGQSDEL